MYEYDTGIANIPVKMGEALTGEKLPPLIGAAGISATAEQVSAAFTEWERRYRQSGARFRQPR